jgi:diacylglycerol kinase (ATP)
LRLAARAAAPHLLSSERALAYPRRVPAQTLAIVNPASRNGATGRRWEAIEGRLREVVAGLEVERTRGPRDAERIAREAARAGVERLVVAGGDGTTSEVVSGLLSAELGGSVALAILPLGTGGDLARTLAVPRDLEAAVAAIQRGKTRRVDAGRLRYTARDGSRRTAYFLNVASFGISGLVDELVNAAPKALGGRVSFLIGTLRALVRYRARDVRISVDGAPVHAGPCVLAAVANGRYFGGGMQIAPEARPDDGSFDVVVVPGLSKARLIAHLPSLYAGRHLERPEVSLFRGRRVDAEAEPGTIWLDVDGEALGTLPASIECLPGAITLFGTSS